MEGHRRRARRSWPGARARLESEFKLAQAERALAAAQERAEQIVAAAEAGHDEALDRAARSLLCAKKSEIGDMRRQPKLNANNMGSRQSDEFEGGPGVRESPAPALRPMNPL
jgi:hypothetical protein